MKTEMKQTEVPPRICTECGIAGHGNLVNHGHFLVEIAIWGAAIYYWFYFVPIILSLSFSIWRRYNRSYYCFECGARMIPLKSPRGREIVREQYKNLAPQKTTS
jgi:hypothetical protein